MLNHAADIFEAVHILESYNIDFRGEPVIHYLIADRSAAAFLLESAGGTINAIFTMATNYPVSAFDQQQGHCARYDKTTESMQASAGNLHSTAEQQLLAGVSQNSTRWSIIYNLEDVVIQLSMG